MPIFEPDPWRWQFFADVACPDDVRIPIKDMEAWEWNPAQRWVYDKLAIALSQGLEAAPHGVVPPFFPVFSKPLMNLRGMGTGSRVIASAEEYAAALTPGHFWCRLLTGAHVSSDVVLVAGAPRWWRHATGAVAAGGTFDHWHVHAEPIAEVEAWCGDWARKHLAGYTGMANFETIGGRIIEAHLRFTDQWPDLYGPGWVEAVVRLYADGTWRFADAGRVEGFSVVAFAPHGRAYRHPPAAVVDAVRAMPGVSSVQITFREEWEPGRHPMPPGGFRVATVNAWNLEAGRAGCALLGRAVVGT